VDQEALSTCLSSPTDNQAPGLCPLCSMTQPQYIPCERASAGAKVILYRGDTQIIYTFESISGEAPHNPPKNKPSEP
jgi:hypothetical protein